MSYEISIWSIDSFSDPSALPSPDSWVIRNNQWSMEGRGWLLNSGPSVLALAEDIPEEVAPLLPGIRHVVHLTLEPIHAAEAGFKALRKTAKAIAKATRGAILDPQADSVELPSGLRRYASPKRGKQSRVSVLQMSWWFEHTAMLEPGAIKALLNTLKLHLPEALPRRYGLYEPPQHELEKTGQDHLEAFLADHLTENVVWYAKPPVAYVFVSIKPSSGWQQLGPKKEYRCNRVSIELDAAALAQAGWPTALLRAWKNISVHLKPFYGDVRTLSGYFRSGRGFTSDGASEPHPTKSWWWKGVPPRLGHAVVLGEPYIQLWPGFTKSSDLDHDLRFASTTDWKTAQDLTGLVGEVPVDIAMEFMPHQATAPGGGRWTVSPENYPRTFPFKRE